MIVKDYPSLAEDEMNTHLNMERTIDFIGQPVYITHAVSCYTPKTPTKAQIEGCSRWVRKRIRECEPSVVLLMGNVAVKAVDIFPTEDDDGNKIKWKNIQSRRGKPVLIDNVWYVPTFSMHDAMKDARKSTVIKKDVELFKYILEKGHPPREESLNYWVVNCPKDGEALLQLLDTHKEVAWDVETTGLYPWDEGAKIISMGFGFPGCEVCLPLNHPEWKYDDHDDWVIKLLDAIDDRIAGKKIRLIAHNGKFDCLWTRVMYGYKWPLHFDTMLAHYLLDENDWHGLTHLSKKYFDAPDYEIALDEKTGHGPIRQHCEYLGLDVHYTLRLKKLFYKELRKDAKLKRIFYKILMPCSRLFTDIEYRGFYIDTKKFGKAEKFLRERIANAEKNLQKIYPHEEGSINWGSTKQLAEVLYEKLEIPIIERTKTGKPGTGESVLKRLDHPITSAILDLRGANQQLSFFIEGWKPFMVGKRIHSSFKLHGTVTGRPSCERPNLQQVPRDPRIRTLITAPKGYTLVEFDLSQIEMRVAAELSNDHNLIEAFLKDIDVHWKTAIREVERGYAYEKEVLETARLEAGVECDYSEAIELLELMGPDRCQDLWKGWKEVRKKAKAVNFGYLYGMWWKKFKRYAFDNYGVHVTDEEAAASREAYFELYPGLVEWHDRQKRYAKRHGYVRNLIGRKRRLPDATGAKLYGKDDNFKAQEALRQAINSPVQSFASDWNLMTVLQVAKEFPPPKVYLVGTVHDAILAEVKKNIVKRFDKRVREIMAAPALLKTFKVKMKVPIEGDVEIGPWGAGVPLSKWQG
jgi:DNA polymerase-1